MMSTLNKIIGWSLSNRWLVLIFSGILVAWGLRVSSLMPIDVFPDFSPVQVQVLTESSYAPEEVESLVTRPLEYALGGTARVRTIRSISMVGLSVITVIFDDGTDIFQARQLVTEKLQGARGRLPASVREPTLAPVSSITGDILKVGLTAGGTTTAMNLRTLADWTIRPRLMAVPGVSNVVIYGGEVKQYQVLVDPLKLRQYNLSLEQLTRAVEESNINASGGTLRTGEQEFQIRGLGRIRSVKDIADHVVAVQNGTPVTIGQVATVKVGPAFQIGDAVIGGKPAVIFNIVKQPWANTLTTTGSVEKALGELSTALPEDVHLVTVFRQADFIEVAVHNVLVALALGGICVAAVLLVFLRNWRTALISLTAIPLSLLVAVIVLHFQGGTINTMTLAGLAIAIGEVVDDAVIDVENVYRRLRENAMSGGRLSAMKVVYEASREIRTSVVYATFIVCLVFLPVLYLGGLEGKIFTPLAISYMVAIAASLVVALTVTPALCYLLLSRSDKLAEHESGVVIWLKQKYEAWLSESISRPWRTLVAALLLFAVSLVPLAFIGKEFLPEFDESNLVVSATAMPGTSLEVTRATGKALTDRLSKDTNVLASGQRIGRGGDDYVQANSSEYDIRLDPKGAGRAREKLRVRQLFAQVLGTVVNVGSYIQHRMDHALSGVNAAIAIKLFGPELPVLHEKARQIDAAIKKVPGIVDAQVEPIVPIPQIGIEVDRAALARYGVSVGDLSRTIETAFQGKAVSQVLEGQASFDLFVWFKPEYRSDLDVIKATLVDTPSGNKVAMGNIAKISYGTSPNTIRHELLSRLVVIQANIAGRDLASVIADVRTAISKDVVLPQGYYVTYGGQFEAEEAASAQLFILSLLACVGIFALLWAAFQSGIAALLVILNLPLALIGGIWAVVLSGGVLSVGSMVGFITLFGISTRNGIMLVSHLNHLSASGRPLVEVLRQACLDRLSPVLMTAFCAGLGVLPIALLGGAGRELEQPLAVVILGGMFSATALTLLVIPALFSLFGKYALKGAGNDGSEALFDGPEKTS